MIILEQRLHRDRMCIMIRGKLSGLIYNTIQNFRGRMYSRTHACFYVPYSQENLRALQNALSPFEKVEVKNYITPVHLKHQASYVKVPVDYTEMLIRKRWAQYFADEKEMANRISSRTFFQNVKNLNNEKSHLHHALFYYCRLENFGFILC